MQYFTRLTRYLIAGVGLTLALPAFAVGTDAGLPVTNAVTLNYQVNGADQPEQLDEVTFVVDRKLDILVQAVDPDWVTAPINQEVTGSPPLTSVPALNFEVFNNSNADIDVVFGVVEQGAVVINGFTNDPGATTTGADGFIVAIDSNGNQVYDEGTDVLLTASGGTYSLPSTLSRVPGSNSVPILVVADISGTAADGDYEAFTLVAAVAEASGVAYLRDQSGNLAPGSSGLPATNIPDDPTLEQEVFADFASTYNAEDVGYDFFGDTGFPTSANYDGQSSDTSGYAIVGVQVLIAKYAEVLYDPVSDNKYDASGNLNAGVEPKAIPGAVIMYVIGVANQDTAFSADDLNIVDDIPDGTGAFELVDEGNQSGATVNYPSLVTVDFDPVPGANTEDFALPAGLDQSVVTVSSCDAVPVISTTAFNAEVGPDTSTGPEVSAALGSCGTTSEGFIVYFVTVETNG